MDLKESALRRDWCGYPAGLPSLALSSSAPKNRVEITLNARTVIPHRKQHSLLEQQMLRNRLIIYHVGPGDATQVIRLGDMYLYLMSHLFF